ncbi:hypothetical protein GOBAR_DD05475 [Gossypium barbadense]|nr:hypothetical protein GOBAR_DD05475 [Gossypium barbadense]
MRYIIIQATLNVSTVPSSSSQEAPSSMLGGYGEGQAHRQQKNLRVSFGQNYFGAQNNGINAGQNSRGYASCGPIMYDSQHGDPGFGRSWAGEFRLGFNDDGPNTSMWQYEQFTHGPIDVGVGHRPNEDYVGIGHRPDENSGPNVNFANPEPGLYRSLSVARVYALLAQLVVVRF